MLNSLLTLGAASLATLLCRGALAQELSVNYVQVAEIEIDPAQLESYEAAVKEHIDTAIRVEPGVRSCTPCPRRITRPGVRVFEVYASTDAYKAHLEAPHFKKYKTMTEKMVKSLRLVQTDSDCARGEA